MIAELRDVAWEVTTLLEFLVVKVAHVLPRRQWTVDK